MALAEALAQFRAGRIELALAGIEAHLARQPADAHAWFLLGACRHALKDLAGAVAAFRRSIELGAGSPEPYLALAAASLDAGLPHNALRACEQALERFPGDHRLLHAAGAALEQLGRDDDALVRYDEAGAIAPLAEETLQRRGHLLARLGRFDQAESHYRAYLSACAGSPRALAGLADVLLARNRYDDVLALAGQASDDALMLLRRGLAFSALRRFSEARVAFEAARTADGRAVEQFVRRVAPGADLELALSPENVFLDRCHAALRDCDWSQWDAMVAEVRRLAQKADVVLEPAVGFMVRFLPLGDAERHGVTAKIAARMEAAAPPLAAAPQRRPSRIRVGVLSPDYRDHLNADLLLPLFELLERRRFEAIAYSLAPDDGSAARARIEAAADGFRDLHAVSDAEAASIIRRDDIDVLVDAGGYTTGARFGVVARRPAHIHVNYLGFSCSLGSRRVDYAIVDRMVAPSPEPWSEALAYLPPTFFLYDYRRTAPEMRLSRAEYGLPTEAFVYCAFHRAEKIAPDVFATWMEILARNLRSILWLHPLSPAASTQLRTQAAHHGVDPARLFFAPFEPRQDPRYLARQRLGDLFLDSPYHNATTTACDALGVGLPILTLPGEAMASRIAASLLHAAGLPGLVVPNREAFIATATRLAENSALLDEYRQKLIRHRSSAPLFDTPARVRSLETAFEHMHARAQRGEPPASFAV